MLDVVALIAYVGPWALAAHLANTFLGMALQAWRNHAHA